MEGRVPGGDEIRVDVGDPCGGSSGGRKAGSSSAVGSRAAAEVGSDSGGGGEWERARGMDGDHGVVNSARGELRKCYWMPGLVGGWADWSHGLGNTGL